MPDIGPTELLIILLIVVLLFGVGRISKIAGELGAGIRAFREGLRGSEAETRQAPPNETPPASEKGEEEEKGEQANSAPKEP